MKHSVLFAGIAAVALAGTAAWAADKASVHHLTIYVPGGVEHIEYVGNVAPKVNVAPVPFAAFMMPRIAFAPFADFRRLSAVMNQQVQQMDAMMRQANAAFANAPIEAAVQGMPAGGQSYSMVSTFSGNGFCSRSVEITTQANGGKPKIVSHSSGNCGAAHETAAHSAADRKGAI